MKLSVKNINNQSSQLFLLAIAWFVTLIGSNLPYLIWCRLPTLQNAMFEIFGNTAYCLSKAKLVLLVLLLILTFIWKTIRPLLQYLIILIAIILIYDLFYWLGSTPFWLLHFNSSSFQVSWISNLLLKLGTAIMICIMMLLIGRKMSSFYMDMGKLDATAAPIRLFGVKRPTNWIRLGTISSIYISMGTLIFLVISYHPSISIVYSAIPFLPVVLLFSMMNAFSEEMIFRGALLAPLCDVVGSKQALLITSINFGLAHLGGIYGGASIVMAVMASFLGWILGKSILETKGLFWAWLIHFFQDFLIFVCLAVGIIR